MNTPHVGFHLDEASEQLRGILQRLRDTDYSEEDFRAHMQHLYHHINYAWNTRAATEQELKRFTDADFVRWSGYPSDLKTLTL